MTKDEALEFVRQNRDALRPCELARRVSLDEDGQYSEFKLILVFASGLRVPLGVMRECAAFWEPTGSRQMSDEEFDERLLEFVRSGAR
ncbi:MAG: hypothetical protein U0269_27875 [Polyangiales bacterium]